MAFLSETLQTLDDAGVRHVVVGGVAAVLHGHARLTLDLDLVIDLDPDAAARAIDALLALGLESGLPVDPRGFADPVRRREWIEEKGMQVFTLRDPRDPTRVVDLFAEPPLPFEELFARSEVMPVGGGQVRVASLSDLIAMKTATGRPKDEQDVEALSRIRDRRRSP